MEKTKKNENKVQNPLKGIIYNLSFKDLYIIGFFCYDFWKHVTLRIFGAGEKIGYLATSTRWDTFISVLFLVNRTIFWGSVMIFFRTKIYLFFWEFSKKSLIFSKKVQELISFLSKIPDRKKLHSNSINLFF